MSNRISLLPGEQIVMSSDKDILTLTTTRVRYDSSSFGSSGLIGITLDSVASCGLVTRSFPILLLICAITLIGAFTQRGDAQVMLIIAAVVLVVVYFLTRRTVITIASNGGQTIRVPSKGMSRKSIIEFIEAIEREKLK